VENKSKNKFIMTNDIYIILALALFKFLIHLIVNFKGGYGIFRDEFYYLACADHLSWGYVDQPPFSILVLSAWKFIFGDSLFSIRFLPALMGGLTVFMTGLLVRKLEGGRPAIVIGCLAVIAAPVLLAMNTIYSMNSIDILLWTLAAYVLIILLKEGRPVNWIILGLLIGIGLLNKISMGWFAAGLIAAVIVTKQRYWLKTKWPYIAGIIALAIFSPYIIWNFANDYAHLEFIRGFSPRTAHDDDAAVHADLDRRIVLFIGIEKGKNIFGSWNHLCNGCDNSGYQRPQQIGISLRHIPGVVRRRGGIYRKNYPG